MQSCTLSFTDMAPKNRKGHFDSQQRTKHLIWLPMSRHVQDKGTNLKKNYGNRTYTACKSVYVYI